MTAQPRGTPPALAHNLRHNKVHARARRDSDRHDAPGAARAAREQITVQNLVRCRTPMRLVYGFMQDPNVPDALRAAQTHGLDIDADDVTYFLGARRFSSPTPRDGDLAREAVRADDAQCGARDRVLPAPAERVVELGVQVEI
jgi:KUP system potassium uptake protein